MSQLFLRLTPAALLLSLALPLAGRAPTPPQPGSPKAEPAAGSFRITANGIGPVRLGMTLQEARAALPGAALQRTSDGEGAALVTLSLGKRDLMDLFAGEENPEGPIEWSRRIDFIETFDEGCRTPEGMGPGSLLADVEKVYGKVVKIVESAIEARQYVTFSRGPKGMVFRIDYSGDFPEGSRETTRYRPGAKLFSVAVVKR